MRQSERHLTIYSQCIKGENNANVAKTYWQSDKIQYSDMSINDLLV